MRLALRKTYDAVPDPKIVIAVGACAISGGPYIDHPEGHNGADQVVPVDLYVPGCPPHPYTILHGLLGLLGRIGARRSGLRTGEAIGKVGAAAKAETLEWGEKRAEGAVKYLGCDLGKKHT
jgi:NADH:ubiquinone oxidoreductase subunit B-like Fe-S oxidoreductase